LVRKHETPQPTPADAIDRLRLARTEGVGPVAYRRLLSRYGSAAAALDVLPGLARAGGRPSPQAVPTPDDAMRELRGFARLGARVIFAGEPDYPPLLALLDDAPAAIAVLVLLSRKSPWPDESFRLLRRGSSLVAVKIPT
jgi:predicted Rossmann fold nucleotide-binding protein DprA/Smf involved in DNA uptake